MKIHITIEATKLVFLRFARAGLIYVLRDEFLGNPTLTVEFLNYL